MPRLTQFAKACILLLSFCLAPAVLAQTKSSPPQPVSPQRPTTLGEGPSTKDPTGGIIYGHDWIVFFGGIPANWVSDTGLANRFGIQEIFHPPDWNPRHIAPCITFSFVHKEKGAATVAQNVANDEQRARARFPEGKILPAPALAVGPKQKAPVRVYKYPQGWDMVVYSAQGNLLFVSTLHCENASQCVPFKPSLAKFVRSLNYKKMTVINETKH